MGEAVFAVGLATKTSDTGVSLLIKYYDADGLPYTKELPPPRDQYAAANMLRAGITTPAVLNSINYADRKKHRTLAI